MRDVTIELLGTDSYEKDENGIDRRVPAVPRQVFAQCKSVSRAEFFEGGRNGLNPELEFRMFAGDYHGEMMLRYLGATYAIYRTYLADGDYIELYAERKGGSNGK